MRTLIPGKAIVLLLLAGCQSTQPVPSSSGVEKALAAAEEHRAHNAFVYLADTAAAAAATTANAPMQGWIVALKDNIHVADMPNTAGTMALKDFVPQEDASVTARLKYAGAIVLGKTNLHELAYGITSNNFAFGAVGNAYDVNLFAGGSSGGTAVAVSLGIVRAGLGTDTGGSARIPAALNGIVGFRPTTGRYPADGLTMISNTRDTVGPMARTVADVIVMDQVLSQDDYLVAPMDLKGLRIGVPRGYFYENLEPQVAERMTLVLNRLGQAGIILVESDLADIGEQNGKVGFPIVLFETRRLMRAYLMEYVPDVSFEELVNKVESPDVKGILQSIVDGAITDDEYKVALEIERPRLQQLYADYFRQEDVAAIVFPTVPATARPIEGSVETVELNGKKVPTFPTYIQNTDPASNAGIPGLSIPAGLSAGGLPIGVEIDGPVGSDQRLLAIGLALEEILRGL